MNSYSKIPSSTVEAIERYVNDRIPMGGFLTSVFSNDLVGAVVRADANNSQCLKDIVLYMYNQCPSGCWGSYEIVNKWIEGKE